MRMVNPNVKSVNWWLLPTLLGLALMAGATPAVLAQSLNCNATIKQVYENPRTGVVGTRVQFDGVTHDQNLTLCDKDGKEEVNDTKFSGSECRDLGATLHIALRSGAKITFTFALTVPKDDEDNPALHCGEIDSWNIKVGDHLGLVYSN